MVHYDYLKMLKNLDWIELAIPRGLATGIGAGRAEQIYYYE